MSSSSPKPPEQYPFGISRVWEYNNRLAIIRSSGDMSRPAIDTWAEVCLRTLDEWPPGQPVFVYQDLSHPNQRQTIYATSVVRQMLGQIARDKRIFVAIALKDTLTNRFYSMILRAFSAANPNFTYTFTTSTDDAYAWIVQRLQQHEHG